MTTVEPRAKAARVPDLRVVERVVKPEKRKKQDLVADLEGLDTNWAVPQVLRLHHLGLQRLEGRISSLNWSVWHIPSFDESQIGKILKDLDALSRHGGSASLLSCLLKKISNMRLPLTMFETNSRGKSSHGKAGQARPASGQHQRRSP